MARLFADDTEKAIEGYRETYSGLTGCMVFILIPIAGFFFFVWEPLGKGLLFVALFTALWTIPLTISASKELKSRKTND
jgi:hypothetical protein